jgi:hypothetical protein
MRLQIKIVCALAFVVSTQLPAQQTATKAVDFAADIQPILSSNCKACHQGGAAPASLRLDSPAGLLQGSISGKIIVPGNAQDSLLVLKITNKSGVGMPPSGPLSEDKIALITAWIDQGAKIPESLLTQKTPAATHWSYIKPVRPALPAVKNATWGHNAIDRFVLARLEKEGLNPSPEASKETLIRRVSLDLNGVPPTPAEVDAFVSDLRPDAYERLVDRLLASPRYGERWATPWLDYARYGDSDGWTNDRQRVSWPYRDWVIRALNQNMPFDQFTIEQLAGDMLPNATVDQKVATGFVRNSMFQDEGGTDPAENNWIAQVERASTVGTVWLGSTIACAQCHNHKYDPFTQQQFYKMVAFFNNVAFGDSGNLKNKKQFAEPVLELPTPEQAQKRDEIRVELKKYQNQLTEATPERLERQAAWEKDLLEFEQRWEPLHPTRVSSSGGATLTAGADGSVLASGKTPDSDTYVLEAKAPIGDITSIRIEALPDASLPGGGPGRDHYGNFMVQGVTVEAGPSGGQLSKVGLKEILTDTPPPYSYVQYASTKIKQVWVVDATRAIKKEEGSKADDVQVPLARIRAQLVLIPDQALTVGADGLLRVTIVQTSEMKGMNLGRFRISVTSAANPKFVLDIPGELRPILSIAPEARNAKQAKDLTAYYRTVAVDLAPVRKKIAELRGQIEDLLIPTALILAEDNKVPHPSTYIRMRGAYVSKGDMVEADVPAFLGPLPADAPPNRLGLAKWLVSRDNPLTARVTVNHFWDTIFGRGIVETAEDFGTQGFAPSHPQLLDWLATEFMDSGWNMKAIQRLIVTSSTYRQSSAVTPALLERDPANNLLARGPRFRVEAEMVRDIALSASGLLSSKMYGPSVMPYQPDGLWGAFPGRRDRPDVWVVSQGDERYRRGLYIFNRRTVRYPSLTVFDAPTHEFCAARRNHSDTPLQALTTLNDPAFFEAAQAMARRIEQEGGATVATRAVYGFRLVTARKPAGQELDSLLTGLAQDREYFASHPKEAEQVSGKADAELAAWTMFSNEILNLDESVTKE